MLLGNANSLQFLKSICAQRIDLVQTSITALVQLSHDGVVLGAFFVVPGILFKILGSAVRQLL
jgi:hypothetical protein